MIKNHYNGLSYRSKNHLMTKVSQFGVGFKALFSICEPQIRGMNNERDLIELFSYVKSTY